VGGSQGEPAAQACTRRSRRARRGALRGAFFFVFGAECVALTSGARSPVRRLADALLNCAPVWNLPSARSPRACVYIRDAAG